MSKTYLDLVETNFPQAVDTFDRATDVTLELLPLVKEYQSLYNNGKLNEAANLLINHPELQSCMINAKTINRCYDAIKALQRYYFSDIQKYIEELVVFRGDYNTSYSYYKYDVVIFNSSAYLCIADSGVGVFPTSDKWVQITLKGDQGIPGIGLHFYGLWSSNITYQKDSCVTYNNALYASIIDNNFGHTPGNDSQYWTLVFDVSEFTVYNNSYSNLNATDLQSAIDEVNVKTNNNANNITINSNNIASNTNSIVTNSNNIKTNSNSINNILNRISNVNNTADKNKEVKYATSAGNSDAVDGFHFTISTTDLTEGSSSLATNMFYFVYK